jgi:SAM-dependent methyltransferase
MILSESLEFTGERFTPECVREIWYEHFHRYAFALDRVRGKKVLDAACGEGYGSALLAAAAASVTGVDLSREAIEHASRRYQAPNLEFRQSDCLQLPFGDGEFECVVSFETLEHLEDHDGLVSEFRRVLAPDGFLLISTPDKAVYTDRLENRNEFHLRELYRAEFESLLSAYFPACRLWGQKLQFQSAIWSLEEGQGVVVRHEAEGSISSSGRPGHDPVYFIAACAAEPGCLPAVGAGLDLFDDAAESVYEHYYHEIRKNMSAGELLIEKEKLISQLKEKLAAKQTPEPWWRRLFKGP